MQTASSASLTYLASRSASEYTITAVMPSSLQARWMRRAISPRLATRIFLNMSVCLLVLSLNDEERLAVFDRLAVLAEDLRDRAGLVSLDLVEDLHRLDDAERVALLHHAADLDERLCAGAGRQIEGADHRRLHQMAGRHFGHGGRHRDGGRDHRRRGRSACGRHRCRNLLDHHAASLDDPNLALGLGDFELGYVRFRHQVDQGLEFAQIHEVSNDGERLSRQIFRITTEFAASLFSLLLIFVFFAEPERLNGDGIAPALPRSR